MLPPGLGMAAHLSRARDVQSPFSAQTELDDDLEYSVQMLLTFGPYIGRYRELQHTRLDKVSKALQPLRDALDPHRTRAAKKVASTRDVALICLLTSMLRWPDREQAIAYLKGFRVVGNLNCPSVFKPLGKQEQVDLERDFYGYTARAEVAALRRLPAPKDASLIWPETAKEVPQGRAG